MSDRNNAALGFTCQLHLSVSANMCSCDAGITADAASCDPHALTASRMSQSLSFGGEEPGNGRLKDLYVVVSCCFGVGLSWTNLLQTPKTSHGVCRMKSSPHVKSTETWMPQTPSSLLFNLGR